jgi:hypothetical protein
MDAQPQERGFGIRQLLGAVNLRDFGQMVGGEVSMLASNAGLAARGARRLPFGPLLFLAAMAFILLRIVLLALVLVFFGGAIVAITAVRSLARLAGRREDDT